MKLLILLYMTNTTGLYSQIYIYGDDDFNHTEYASTKGIISEIDGHMIIKFAFGRAFLDKTPDGDLSSRTTIDVNVCRGNQIFGVLTMNMTTLLATTGGKQLRGVPISMHFNNRNIYPGNLTGKIICIEKNDQWYISSLRVRIPLAAFKKWCQSIDHLL